VYGNYIKPLGDFLIAILLLIFCAPMIVLICILLSIQNNGSFLFLQQRPGLKGKPFKIIKFKTMRDVFDQSGQLLPDDLRITPLGSIVRKCSLDEVLQLINVLKGEMSIVGPRPLLMKYLLLYDDLQHKRHDVLPGITGWAQVNGRNNLSWKKKFKLDLEYLTKRSFLLDAKILILTFFIVLTRSGVNEDGCHTTTEFKGSSAI
jgi:undecaprenyl phosphate N,N'-diacetylbacillosamine 1-phosphate transferase